MSSTISNINPSSSPGLSLLATSDKSSDADLTPQEQKNRQKKQVAAEKKAQKQKELSKFLASLDVPSMGNMRPMPLVEVDTNVSSGVANKLVTKKEDENSKGERVTSTGAVKRKSPKALHELEKDEKRVVLGMIKNDLMQRVEVKGNKRVVSGVVRIGPADEKAEVADPGKEYQTATALYESLKKRVKKAANSTSASKLLRFKGFHSIIKVDTIDHQKRVELVAQDLRKIVRLSFEHTKPEASYDFKSQARTLTFKCTCLGYEPAPAPPPAPAAARSASTPPAFAAKGTSGDLIRQARAWMASALNATSSVGSAGAAQVPAPQTQSVGIPRFCGGVVKITALDDTRHPLGIVGQRVVISVEHKTAK
ncbi:hypothetical protein CVT26_000889 [Gymnopilus dilepis]|uniref:Uncharacterized protein n=1 Tax=Gymnopilus dilepis TaxID=231916 RepID=A0A409WB84_9AGAR|nr:hypothetical protein CVT26_000889 [Gymnopilus dilepis]